MGDKFIPNGDMEFLHMARNFATTLAKDPQVYRVSREDSDACSAAFEVYRQALQEAHGGKTRSPRATRAKNRTREEAERIIRRLANMIRADESIDSQAKFLLRMRERPRAKQQTCPLEPPRLRFLRALHEGGGSTPVHELEFRGMDFSSTKPAGAVRLELFVDLVSPDEAIPKFPGANLGGRPWYLRSFTRSPIKLMPPMTRLPMRVVYWGRWADSTGNVGPFSATAVAWIEGGSHHLLAPEIGNGPKRPALLEDANDARDPILRVVVLEAMEESFNGQSMMPALPEQREMKQLEDQNEAA